MLFFYYSKYLSLYNSFYLKIRPTVKSIIYLFSHSLSLSLSLAHTQSISLLHKSLVCFCFIVEDQEKEASIFMLSHHTLSQLIHPSPSIASSPSLLAKTLSALSHTHFCSFYSPHFSVAVPSVVIFFFCSLRSCNCTLKLQSLKEFPLLL